MPGSAEVFARALEGGVDVPAHGELRRDLAIADALVKAGAPAGPDPAARARMKARLLAELAATPLQAEPRVAEPRLPEPRAAQPRQAEVPAPIDLAARRRSMTVGLQGRLLVAAAAALCLLVALSGMSLVLARDALPGDALYGVKRSAESAELGLTFGDEPRGFKHLQFATARIDEVEALAARGATDDSRPYLTALQSFDSDAASGARLLIESGTNGTGDELNTLREWAEQQAQRLQVVAPAMPGKAVGRSVGSFVLLTKVRDRAVALQQRMTCLAVTSGARDEIGLLPADGLCVPAQGPSVLSTKLPDSSQRGGAGEQGAPPLVIRPSQSAQPGDPLGPLDPGGSGSGDPSQGTQTPPGGGTAEAPSPSGEAPPPASEPATITVPLPLPLPSITLPPLLPGLPGLRLG